jgi:hypothetical protein
MGTRLELHNILISITPYVYFQPPESVRLTYPCIIYNINSEKSLYADDYMYGNTMRYNITVIDKNPESDIPNQIRTLQMCSFDRKFTKDNLHHTVFNIYF